jgi:hypothetical protein
MTTQSKLIVWLCLGANREDKGRNPRKETPNAAA